MQAFQEKDDTVLNISKEMKANITKVAAQRAIDGTDLKTAEQQSRLKWRRGENNLNITTPQNLKG